MLNDKWKPCEGALLWKPIFFKWKVRIKFQYIDGRGLFAPQKNICIFNIYIVIYIFTYDNFIHIHVYVLVYLHLILEKTLL